VSWGERAQVQIAHDIWSEKKNKPLPNTVTT